MNILDCLSNEHLSFLANLIIWINIFGCSFAAYWTCNASKGGIPEMRRAFFITYGFCLAYIFAYVLFILTDVDFYAWSMIMRGLSIATWMIVWTWPAILSVRIWRRLSERVQSALIEKENEL